MENFSHWVLKVILLLNILFTYQVVESNYNVEDVLRSPLKTAYRMTTASFVRNNTLYFWGGGGSIWTTTYSIVAPYFESVRLDETNGNLVYSTVNNSKDYTNYSTGASAVLLDDNERVLFIGGAREPDKSINESGSLYMEQYDFRTASWESLPVRLASSINQSIPTPRNRQQLGATLAPNGKVYIAGGLLTNNYTDDYDIWEYDPVGEVFAPVEEGGRLPLSADVLALLDHGSVLLPRNGRIVYVTDVSNYVRILDTNTNSVYIQDTTGYWNIPGGGVRGLNVSERYPQYRFNGHAMLAPNERYIYLYGGCIQYNHYETCSSDVAILDTDTWEWIPPKAMLGLQQNARFHCTAAIVNDGYMIITHGHTITYNWLNDFNVLRLPDPSDPAGYFVWVSNITESTEDIVQSSIKQVDVDGASSYLVPRLSAGGIAGVTIGSVALVLAIIFLLYRWGYNAKTGVTYYIVNRYILWGRRTGEPRWTELSHFITRVVLICLFIAYVGYSIVLISRSPITAFTITSPADKVAFPDLRICFNGLSAIDYFNVESGGMSSRDFVDQNFFQRLNGSGIVDLDDASYNMSGIMNCWLFTPPPNFTLTNSGPSDGGKLRFLFDLDPIHESSGPNIQIELYPHGRNPNLALYADINQPYITPSEYEEWLRADFNGMQFKNRYQLEFNAHTSISYCIQKYKKFTPSLWNNIGFAPIYHSFPELVTTVQTNPLQNVSHDANSIDIYPSSMVETTLQEQRIYTLFTIIGPASGIFALLVALDGVLFGVRPRSPWGLVHRFSFGKLRHSLLNNLYNTFGGLQRPIPLINPVDSQAFDNKDGFHWNNEKRISTSSLLFWRQESGNQQDNISNIINRQPPLYSHRYSTTSSISIPTFPSETKAESHLLQETESRLHETTKELAKTKARHNELERRVQLLEIMLKTYYINDEVFLNLYNAHELNAHGHDDLDSDGARASITLIESIDSLSVASSSSSTRTEKRNTVMTSDPFRNRLFGRLRSVSSNNNATTLERQNSDVLSDATFASPLSVGDLNEDR
ncbi:hypothetical protein BDA99DRAFT_561094 [Phascolomyces articulosus]|uniref:Galactose oxidase n=1 Tax=Phascolomyces articulosus TaxID=60185 RepID=A0AAD5K870_9FUNG|nr:hypothetical protein BDA99DRAFT_561094 [Phascolomyces articulosus]